MDDVADFDNCFKFPKSKSNVSNANISNNNCCIGKTIFARRLYSVPINVVNVFPAIKPNVFVRIMGRSNILRSP
ncbi:unnamed protein product [Rotaria sp. Silwood1]|nr:unnamed protein product [Rotaria sp. Silwood1]